MSRELRRQRVQDLVNSYIENRDTYVASGSLYNETQLRTDFLNPLLMALGWDVPNAGHAPHHLREVVHEDSVVVDDDGIVLKKKPDYALTVAGERKLFVEAKKPSVSILDAIAPALQIRRYGWNAKLPISILTNFDKLVVYDCRPRPESNDDPRVARLLVLDHTEYVDRFDEIYELFSREAVFSGALDEQFPVDGILAGSEPFDEYFLQEIESWRLELAEDIAAHNPAVDQGELEFIVQRLLNRVIFLRICEDRELERYQQLQSVTSYDDLKALFLQADRRYNSGLFDFIEDALSLTVDVSSDVLVAIFRDLYYPESPYAFAVVGSGILGEIYERFLSRQIVLRGDQEVTVVDKDEVAASQGAVPTPSYIVESIVQKALGPLCQGKAPDDLLSLRVADIACGSGSFLVAAYQYLLNYHLEWYTQHDPASHSDAVFLGSHNTWHLTLGERQRLLTTHIFGVDLDQQAIEITQFSLLLKVLDDIPASAVQGHFRAGGRPTLPSLDANIQCGNSLVDSRYLDFDGTLLQDEETYMAIRPFEFTEAFPTVFMHQGGFDAIIGNPPYIRIQNMVRYSPKEVSYYQSADSPYSTAESDNFDKYVLFVERAIQLLSPEGRLVYIVPNKFFTVRSGRALRRLLSAGDHVAEIVHFGVLQVFGSKRTTYTCILSITKQPNEEFTVEHVQSLDQWRRGIQHELLSYQHGHIGEQSWEFVTPAVQALFDRIRRENPAKLRDVAEIFVGVQTSRDSVYILTPTDNTDGEVTFVGTEGREWSVERAILRPCLKDVTLPAFSRPKANAYIIFPYDLENRRAVLYTPQQMRDRFPLCWSYLNAHREDLQCRSIQGGTEDTWYRFGRSQSLTKFDGSEKLVWPTLGLDARYSFDDQDIVFTGGGNGPYYGLRPRPATRLSIHYLQAILHHPVVEAMVRATSSAFRGGYVSHGKQFIAEIPIPIIDFADPDGQAAHDQIVGLVQNLIQATAQAADESLPAVRNLAYRRILQLRQALQREITGLYCITPEELAAVAQDEEYDVV